MTKRRENILDIIADMRKAIKKDKPLTGADIKEYLNRLESSGKSLLDKSINLYRLLKEAVNEWCLNCSMYKNADRMECSDVEGRCFVQRWMNEINKGHPYITGTTDDTEEERK